MRITGASQCYGCGRTVIVRDTNDPHELHAVLREHSGDCPEVLSELDRIADEEHQERRERWSE